MKLSNFRFYQPKGKKFKTGFEVYDNPFLKDLREIIRKNMGVFEFANQFFYLHTDNNQDANDAKASLEVDRDILEQEFNDDPKLPPFSVKLVDQLINLLLKLYKLSCREYRKIRDLYIELIVLYWKTTPGNRAKVYQEPEIFYRRKKMFDKKKFSNSKCDVVHIDNKRNTFEMYECKTTMQAFLSDLSTDSRIEPEKEKKKTILRSKRKQNYMSAFFSLINNKVDNIVNSEIAYATLAPQCDLFIKGQNRNSIGCIKILTRENLSQAFLNL